MFAIANSELAKASNWFKANKVTLDVKKTKCMIFSSHNKNIDISNLSIKMDNKKVEQIDNNWKKILYICWTCVGCQFDLGRAY